MNEKFFISYKSENREIALRVRDVIRSWGYTTWMDVDEIKGGEYWPDEIQRGLEESRAVVGVVTSCANKSHEVQAEWNYGFKNSGLILLRYEDVAVPYRFAILNYIDCFRDEALAFEKLHDAIINLPEPSPYLPPKPQAPRDPNHIRMLKNVYDAWILGVLKPNLEAGAIELSLGLKADAVLRHAYYGDYSLPTKSQDIAKIFSDMNGELLILGEPGSGKTILMLQLAEKLLAQAQMDEREPIPVILNLSSWAQKCEPLDKWLIAELKRNYAVPKKQSAKWLNDQKLTLLLDGLDEIAPAKLFGDEQCQETLEAETIQLRSEAVDAINTFLRANPNVQVAICSRIRDYEALAHKLDLNSAILLQKLSDTQINDYLQGDECVGIRQLIKEEASARHLAETPFVLGTMKHTYAGDPYTANPHKSLKLETASEENRYNHLFNRFVHKQLDDALHSPYSHQKEQDLLAWLANKMQAHKLSVFYLEDLQADWSDHEKLYRLAVMLVISLICGLSFGMIYGTIFGIGNGVIVSADSLMIFGLNEGLTYDLPHGLSVGLGFGLSLGFFLNLLNKNLNETTSSQKKYGVGFGFIVSSFFTLSYTLNYVWNYVISFQVSLEGNSYLPTCDPSFYSPEIYRGLNDPCIAHYNVYELSIGLFAGQILGMLLGLYQREVSEKSLSSSLKYVPIVGLCVGLIYGLGYARLFYLNSGWVSGLDVGIIFGLSYAVFTCLGYGVFLLLKSLKGMPSFRTINGLDLGLLVGVSLGISAFAAYTLLFGVQLYNITNNLIYGLAFGLSAGLLTSLSYGMFSVLISIHFAEKLTTPNLKSGLLAGLTLAVILSLLIAVSMGMVYIWIGYIDGQIITYLLKYGLSFGASFGLALGLIVVFKKDIFVQARLTPNKGQKLSIRNGSALSLLAFIMITAALSIIYSISISLRVGLGIGIIFGLFYGLTSVIQHGILRLFLAKEGHMPLGRYDSFLDQAASANILRKVGGGYIFRHRMLLEYLAKEYTLQETS